MDSEATNADSNASSDSSSTESNGFDSSDSESNNSDDSEDNDGFHKRYNGPDADVILLSDDGIKFRVHSVLLKASSKVLVDKLTDAGSDPIALTAHSKTLALLLDFLYPTSRPSLPRPATLEQGAILADFANELGIMFSRIYGPSFLQRINTTRHPLIYMSLLVSGGGRTLLH